MSNFELKWNGDKVLEKAREAARFGVDATMADCVLEAKQKHQVPGGGEFQSIRTRSMFKPYWVNRTSTAEGSIRIVNFAELHGTITRGIWGSADVMYFIFLEIFHGSILRRTADSIYPRLGKYIKERFSKS